ncbi:PQQ-binding-like beta-propeller repeat protein [Streptomyces sp. DT20]|uniref:PQQ-binding-like beta-propeller repeat protein n=1 Tax=unclassified Streptomyces TaxID=2593676 RepID=UPI0009A133C1|nr:PQQ-binding-like beta-propeller repeat protein [Streptomyces sp. CB02488]
MQDGQITRRQLMQWGAVGAGALAVTGLPATDALAAPRSGVRVTDLGPGVNNFSLAAAIPVGNKAYIASRNIDPTRIIGFDFDTEKVTSVTEGPGISTQLLAVDPDGRYLYSAIREYDTAPGPGFIRLDLSVADAPKEDLHSIPGLDPYAISASPDNKIFFGGREPQPKLRQYDPATGELTEIAIPDPDVPMIRCLLATQDKIYIGTGASLGATPNSTKAGLFVMDRATKKITSILPKEFAGQVEVRDVGLYDGTLYVCSTTADGAAVAIMDAEDPAQYTLVQSKQSFLRLPRKLGDKMYFNGAALIELTLSTGKFREIKPKDGDFGELWGLWIREEKVIVVSAFGLIFEVDPSTGTDTSWDLIEAGAPIGPQLAMSVAADTHNVYVGGTNSVARHDLRTGKQSRVLATSEAKDILLHKGTAYLAQYNAVGLLAYNPRTDDEWTRKLADLPPKQNRPHQIVWDDRHQLALMGLQSDYNAGGSLMTFDPRKGATTVAVNPIDDDQMVRAVVAHDGVAYLGGQNVAATAGTLVAWDPVRKRELWRMTPQDKPTGITGLTVLGHHLYVMCFKGDFFVIDLRTRKVIHSANHGPVVPNYGTLLADRGYVYGASSSDFVRYDRKTFARTDLVALDADWYGIPRAAVDERGRFYAIRGRNLIRIEVGRR